MIELKNLNNEKPYLIFKELYDKSIYAKQENIEAILIASFSIDSNEVDARYVNLKIIDGDKFIFFSNYNSPKSTQFNSHSQISAVLFWNSINTQIRMKAYISKVPAKISNEYFKLRSEDKNALAISSMQSTQIRSYEDVEIKYKKTLNEANLTIRPEYWGGYSFVPYCFEFWEGHKSRLNKRDLYQLKNNKWQHSILQP